MGTCVGVVLTERESSLSVAEDGSAEAFYVCSYYNIVGGAVWCPRGLKGLDFYVRSCTAPRRAKGFYVWST